MQRAWDLGLADRTNPFDEPIERRWMKQWLFYANSIRLGSAMGGPDHTSFQTGWFDLTTPCERCRNGSTRAQKLSDAEDDFWFIMMH
jgi:hypothetical protein